MFNPSQQTRISILAGGLLALLAVGLGSTVNLAPMPDEPIELDDGAARRIDSLAEWEEATSSGLVVLFVDCDWNSDIGAYHREFHEFALWCRNHTNVTPITVKVDSDSEDELWHVLQDLWEQYRIPTGGLKTYGGAGKLVWFDDGLVSAHSTCFRLRDAESLITYSEPTYSSTLNRR